MALEPPPHAGRRPGSLRASDGASSSGLKSASSEVNAADSMRAVAARLEKHTAALRSAMDKPTSRLDDGTASGASAKGAVAVAAARALDADATDAADAASSSSDDDADAAAHLSTRLNSYRTADVYIKKAAAKIAAHKKWYADRAKRENASQDCAGALEELRLASMALQQRHDEDAADAHINTARGRRDKTKTTSEGDVTLIPSSSAIAHSELSDISACVDALVATTARLRSDADAAAAREMQKRAELALAKKQRDDAVAEAQTERVARETAPVKIVVKRVPTISSSSDRKPEKSSIKDTASERKGRLSGETAKLRDPLRDRARATLTKNKSVDEDAPRGNDKASRLKPKPNPPIETHPTPVDPNPELIDALRLKTEACDDLERRLAKAHAHFETQTRAFEAAASDAAERLEECDSQKRKIAEEGARWRALYVAMRDDLDRGVGADEAERMRDALRQSEDKHRRELTLLGAEHGNQCASLRRALADTERERVGMASAVDASKRACTRAEEALVAEREARREAEVLKRRSDTESRRVSKRCEALEADVESLKKSLEETERASRDLQKAETAARQNALREADELRDEASRDVDWRVESLEARLASALESAKREKARADDAERALDDARRLAVEQQAQMAEAARARK